MLFASCSRDCAIDNASSKARSPAAWAQHGGAHAHWAFSVEPMVCLTPLYIYTLQYRSVTDGQTDGQTDIPPLAIPALA